MSTLNTFIQHNFGSPSHINWRRKINKGNPNWKIRSETAAVFADDIMLCMENLKHPTREGLEVLVNSVTLLDKKLKYRNMLHFYILKNKYKTQKLRK